MTSTARVHDCDYDVSIVGYGPVAATTALLLARRGLRVSIHERSTVPLELPRAVGLDGESNRLFQSIGLGREAEALEAYRMAQSASLDMGRGPGLLELKVTALELRLGQADVADGALQ